MTEMRKVIFATSFSLLAVAACAGFRTGERSPQAAAIEVVPDRASETYSVGERIGWTLTLRSPRPQSAFDHSYQIKRNNQVVIQSGSLDLTSGQARIELVGAEPEMLYVEVDPAPGRRPLTFGAAVSPRHLKPVVPRPRDFDAFWKAKVAALEAIPANPVLTPKPSGRPDVEYATIRMDHVNGTHVYGQIAWPTRPGKHPAMLILQWASPPYPLDPSWVIGRAAEGWIALNIEPHNVLPTEARSYYAALPNEIKHYEGVGQHDRDKNFFVEMYLRDYRAADYLTQLPDWDKKTLVVTGGSMGGQQSLCVAGLHPKITHVIVEEPAGCDLNAGLHGRQEGYPFLNTGDTTTMEVARYIDCVNFAPRIRAASLVAMGYIDNVAPPAGIWTALNLIRGRTEAAPMPDAPHNNLATAQQQRPYYDRAGAWMNALVNGRAIPPAVHQ